MAVKRNKFSLGGPASLASEKSLGEFRASSIIVTERGCSTVKPRKGIVRRLDPGNLVGLMQALDQGDQLPPVGLLADGTLVYGAHRLAAAQLLATEPAVRVAALEKYPLQRPLTAEELERLKAPAGRKAVELRADGTSDPEAEIRENARRRQLTPELVSEQMALLVSHGYGEGMGRPKKGTKGNAIPRLAAIWGVTPRALQMHLHKARGGESEPAEPRSTREEGKSEAQKVLGRLDKSLKQLLVATAKGKISVRIETLQAAKALLELVQQEQAGALPADGAARNAPERSKRKASSQEATSS